MFPGKMQISTANDGGFTVPVRGGSGTGAVTYKSSNDNIASVRGVTSVNGGANNDGEITIKAPGSITITATKAADANYNKATATFELLVVKVVIPDGATARQVKSEDEILLLLLLLMKPVKHSRSIMLATTIMIYACSCRPPSLGRPR